jgi:hypothetical protein
MYRWPVVVPGSLPELKDNILKSPFVRIHEEQDAGNRLVEFQQEDDNILGYTGKKSLCISATNTKDAVDKAEYLARAQHLLTVSGGSGEEALDHKLEVEFEVVDAPDQGILRNDGKDTVFEDKHAVVTLRNKGLETIFVSVFHVNVWGKTYHVSRGSSLGISLPPDQQYILGQRDFNSTKKGLKLSWPDKFPRREGICERLVFFVTSHEVDLRDFSRDRPQERKGAELNMSGLEKLAYRLAFRNGREFEMEREPSFVLKYDVLHWPYLLCPQEAQNP